MYQDGLLDRHDFLLFLIKWVHELKLSESDDTLKHLVQVILTYFDDVTENFVLARCTAYMCVTKLGSLTEINNIRSPFEWDLTPEQIEQMRYEISESTEDIRVRSVISEERWLMCEDNSPPSALAMLAALDEHNFYISQTGVGTQYLIN
eukprot:sb/3473605/